MNTHCAVLLVSHLASVLRTVHEYKENSDMHSNIINSHRSSNRWHRKTNPQWKPMPRRTVCHLLIGTAAAAARPMEPRRDHTDQCLWAPRNTVRSTKTEKCVYNLKLQLITMFWISFQFTSGCLSPYANIILAREKYQMFREVPHVSIT